MPGDDLINVLSLTRECGGNVRRNSVVVCITGYTFLNVKQVKLLSSSIQKTSSLLTSSGEMNPDKHKR